MKKVIVTVILTLVLLSTVVLVGCAPTETRINNFSVGPNPSVEVTVGNGNVNLVVGTEGQIAITADLKNPDRIDYTVAQVGDVITIIAETETGSRANVTVTVPENTEFVLITGNGNVDVTDVQASGQVNSGNGSIKLQETNGDITGNTGNGSITMSDIEGSYNLNIGNGSIKATGAAGSFWMNTGNGDISITDATGFFILSVGNGGISFEGELTPGNDNNVSVGNGSITMEITGSPSLSLDLEIESQGRVRCDLPVTVSEQSEHRLIGTVGNGEATLIARTGSGNITIR
ncbi:MAG TPA: DUF4097 domain-containing protein [Dehalococcoidia bacterium]|nr:DUF4097 domain-containing protein [Dehalococcoidia bacterium]